jgi:hypothetical protein
VEEDELQRATALALAEMDFYDGVESPQEMTQEAESDWENYEFTCPEHGPHNGFSIGNAKSKLCPVCSKAKRDRALMAQRDEVKGAREILSKYPWLDAWMTETAEQDGVENRWEVIAAAVARGIPAEWFRKLAMRGFDRK